MGEKEQKMKEEQEKKLKQENNEQEDEKIDLPNKASKSATGKDLAKENEEAKNSVSTNNSNSAVEVNPIKEEAGGQKIQTGEKRLKILDNELLKSNPFSALLQNGDADTTKRNKGNEAGIDKKNKHSITPIDTLDPLTTSTADTGTTGASSTAGTATTTSATDTNTDNATTTEDDE